MVSFFEPAILTLDWLYGTYVQYSGIEVSIGRGQKLEGGFWIF